MTKNDATAYYDANQKRTRLLSAVNKLRQLSIAKKILLLTVVALLFMSGFVVVSEQPGFCNSCHIMNTYYDSWKTSSHSEVNCLDCHFEPGIVGHVKGKIDGGAQAVAFIVGRVGTKPSATVLDSSCLRPDCHSIGKLVSKPSDYNSAKFTHKGHVSTEVDGIKISCGTCHSRFEGEEHFSVNNNACYTCHFLVGGRGDARAVETECRDCHEVPKQIIRRGLVEVNHAEFVSYEASCDDSCHRKQIKKVSLVDEAVCLNCHSYRKETQMSSAELHKLHSEGDKVECFACHGEVAHVARKDVTVTGMIDCRDCHSNTHEAQRSIYTAENHSQEKQAGRVLSPMFLTHVECTGCHIEPVRRNSGTLDSFGVVAKAVPKACDKCHEQGTGERYIPFWQGKVKKLHGQVNTRLSRLQERARLETDEKTVEELEEKIHQARALLDTVESDGSWGVHNLKYTEAMLLRANEIIVGTQ